MSITPKQLLEFSQALNTVNANEVARRCAIGRSYYAAFHLAKEFHATLSQPGTVVSSRAGVYEKLYQRLENPTISRADPRHLISRRVAAIARQIKNARTKADYELGQTIDLEMADEVIVHTLKLKALVESHGKSTLSGSQTLDTHQPSQPHTLAG
jgi:uncharacterized protein (UPF0332 family)